MCCCNWSGRGMWMAEVSAWSWLIASVLFVCVWERVNVFVLCHCCLGSKGSLHCLHHNICKVLVRRVVLCGEWLGKSELPLFIYWFKHFLLGSVLTKSLILKHNCLSLSEQDELLRRQMPSLLSLSFSQCHVLKYWGCWEHVVQQTVLRTHVLVCWKPVQKYWVSCWWT